MGLIICSFSGEHIWTFSFSMTLIHDMNKERQAGTHPAIPSHKPTLKSRDVAHTEEVGRGSLSPKLTLFT